MTDRPLFRPEAVEHHARGLVTNRRQLDLSNRTTTRAFQVLVLGIVAALVAAFTIRADESARGTATDRNGAVVVLVPIGALPKLRPGQLVKVTVGDRVLEGHVTQVGSPVAGPPAAVPVTTSIRSELPDDPPEAVVRLNRRAIAEILLPGLRGFFGASDG